MTVEEMWEEIGKMPGAPWVEVGFAHDEKGAVHTVASVYMDGCGSGRYFIHEQTLSEALFQVRELLREHFTHDYRETCRWCKP